MHITRLEVSGFKSLRDVSIPLHPLSLFVGANGSGKSNVLEVLRVLQGLALGLTAKEALGGVTRPGVQWDGVRGGSVGALTKLPNLDPGAELSISVAFQAHSELSVWSRGKYECRLGTAMEVIPVPKTLLAERAELVVDEKHLVLSRSWDADGEQRFIEDWQFAVDDTERSSGRRELSITEAEFGSKFLGEGKGAWTEFATEDAWTENGTQSSAELFRGAFSIVTEEWAGFLRDFRLLRLLSQNMRKPWPTTFQEMGESGEGFGPVIREIVSDKENKERLLEWLSELLPLQVVDIDLLEPTQGNYLVEIAEALEEGGEKVWRSAEVLSDGTLHFLGLLAALFGAGRDRNRNGGESRLIGLEDIEENLHPSRLETLVELLDRMTARDEESDGTDLQVLATTHAPQVLDWFEPEDLEQVVYFWRDPDTLETKTRPVSEFEHLDRILERGVPLSELHSEDWFAGEVE